MSRLLFVLVAAFALSGPTVAQGADSAGLLGASADPRAAPAGEYRLDHEHISLIARVSHRGVSISTVRFGRAEGALKWNPEDIESSSVDITVDAASLTTPIAFLFPPTGEMFLNVARYPTARFVSSGVERTGPTRGLIHGDLTLMGVTRPAVISGELIGARETAGVMAVGFHGQMKIKRSEFGNRTFATGVGNEVELAIDVEFLKN